MDLLPVANPTKSFWLTAEDDFATFRSTPELPAEADVVIVGSGYAGATTAHYLLPQFKGSVLMLEARNVCSGATARNGGHLKPDLYYSHNDFREKYGEAGAAEIINFEHAHLQAMKELVEGEQIDCDFVLTRACDVHVHGTAAERAVANYTEMCKNPHVRCKQDVQLTQGDAARVISKVDGSPVCVTYTAGQLWPYKLVTAVLRKAVAAGLNLQTNTPVVATERLGDGRYLVRTPRGAVVAGRLVLATNAYTASVEPRFRNKIVPIKGACSHIVPVSAADRAPHLTNTYGIRFAGADTDYLINRPDGSVVLGGAKKHIFPYKDRFYNVVDDSTLIPGSEAYFSGYLEKMFYTWKGVATHADHVWSGILGYTDDTLPYVGALPDEPRKYVIAGFHGHGMPRVLLCARALAGSLAADAAGVGGDPAPGLADIPAAFRITPDRMTATENRILQSLQPAPVPKL